MDRHKARQLNRILRTLLTLVAAAAVGTASEAKKSGEKRTKVDSIVLHSIGGPECSADNGRVVFKRVGGDADTWKQYFANHPTLGIHWIVDREGRTLAGVPEDQVANHARGFNRTSIGIELVNDGNGKDEFSRAQVQALIRLIREIQGRWNIAPRDIKRHADIDKGPALPCGSPRRVDPGSNLPFDEIIERAQR